jgi:membrane protein
MASSRFGTGGKVGRPPGAGESEVFAIPLSANHRFARPAPGVRAAATYASGMDASSSPWRQAAARLWTRISPEDVQIRAAGVAFYAFLALLPGMLAVVMLYGTLADPAHVRDQLALLAPLFPPDAAEFLGGQLVEMAQRSKASLSLSAAASLCFGIWGASKGIRALLHTLGTGTPGVDTRGRVGRGVRALALAAGAVSVVVLAVAVMIVFPSLLRHLGRESAAAALIRLGRWPLLALAVFAWLALLYRTRPHQGDRPWRWNLLGAAVATAVWLLASVVFSSFVARFGGKDLLYGSLAAAVMLLTWLLLAAYAAILGAEVADTARWMATTTKTARPADAPGARRPHAGGTR